MSLKKEKTPLPNVEQDQERAIFILSTKLDNEKELCNGNDFLLTPRNKVNSLTLRSTEKVYIINGSKAEKFLFFCKEHLRLRNLFYWLGVGIASYPTAFIIASIIIASLSMGMINIQLKDRTNDGYTPSTSRAKYETDVYKEFFGAVGDTLPTSIIIKAKDGGSMHRLKYLEEADKLLTYLHSNLSIPYPSSEFPSQYIKYQNICGAFCDSNIIIHYFYLSLLNEYNKNLGGKKINKLTYPRSKISGYIFPLEKNFFGVQNNYYTEDEIENDEELKNLKNITDFDYIQMILAPFLGDKSSPENEEKMGVWDLGAYHYLQNTYQSKYIDVVSIGAKIVDYEMNRASQKTIPYFAFGFCVMFLFVFVTVFSSSIYFNSIDLGKILAAIGISLCPVLAVTTTFGCLTILGFRTNSVMLIMPFLIMGIGINDSFLILHSFLKPTYNKVTPKHLLGLVFEDVGPSITITTFTNVITFAIGALTPTPEIALFCLATAVALGLAYIYSLILFGPILYYTAKCSSKKKELEKNYNEKNNKTIECLRKIFKKIRVIYCNIISNPWFAIFLLIGSGVYWYFAIMGTLNIQSRLDTEKILPKDSPLVEPHKLIAHVVWNEYYPVTVIVNNPPDIRNDDDVKIFNNMVNDFENLDKCKGKEFSMIWLRSYEKYVKDSKLFIGWDYNEEDEKNKDDEKLNYKDFRGFLKSPIEKVWNAFIKLKNTSDYATGNPIKSFWFLVAYHNIDNWDDRIDIMLKWRKIADNYPNFNVTVWEANGMFVDQMLSLKTLTIQTTIVTLLCMTIVCAIFIQNPIAVLFAVLSIASICIGVLGFLSWWHLDLDPVSLGAVLMSIGMSVDFTAHVCYHFQLKSKKIFKGTQITKEPMNSTKEKLYHTIDSVAWPMMQGGISTVLCVMPLICLKDYIPLVFFKTICLVAIWGLFHGLVLLPTFIQYIPRRWIEWSCYRYINKSSSIPDSSSTFKESLEISLESNDKQQHN
ncbi:Sterol-sensing domain and Patched family-containing protein [Strongyloides ratti]|uniref:Sterol-sensing domain and Patched family-containing protein n=1 Tax=Strongyloides ratti TaxID=34506 RepID=A0A090LAD5_STRRB|nr:Sterol-sensing domain and Patched family-containing protein [Strongyloides ratti]CEF66711.1 Sterol-sensing domain and Patched family-containing protein [Strongyloides ratti]